VAHLGGWGAPTFFTNRAAQGIAECEHALLLDRNLADAHSDIGLAKYFMGQSCETEGHILEAFRLSPRDLRANQWMHFVGIAKIQLGADTERSRGYDEALRPTAFPHFSFCVGRCLGVARAVDEARTVAKARLRSSRAIPSAACVPTNSATIRLTLLGGGAVLRRLALGRCARGLMSELGHSRRFGRVPRTSALPL